MGQVQAAEDSLLCQIDEECSVFKAGYVCKDAPEDGFKDMKVHDIDGNDVTTKAKRYCAHKDLWPPTPKEWIGSVVFAFIMLLSNVGGIGGGGVAIPIAMYFFDLAFKPAIAISSFAIMISSLARLIYHFNERHPEKPNCTTIDYGMTNVMMPLTLIGSLLGAYVYNTFPDVILIIITTLLLAYLCWESIQKLITMRRKEDEIAKKAND